MDVIQAFPATGHRWCLPPVGNVLGPEAPREWKWTPLPRELSVSAQLKPVPGQLSWGLAYAGPGDTWEMWGQWGEAEGEEVRARLGGKRNGVAGRGNSKCKGLGQEISRSLVLWVVGCSQGSWIQTTETDSGAVGRKGASWRVTVWSQRIKDTQAGWSSGAWRLRPWPNPHRRNSPGREALSWIDDACSHREHHLWTLEATRWTGP